MNRFNQNRGFLSMIFCKTRELVHGVVIFSSENINQSGKEWRHEVLYLIMLLLRSVMCTIDYESTGEVAWNLPEMDESTKRMLRKNLYLNEDNRQFSLQKHTTEREENMRVPIRLAFKLRQAIMSQRTALSKPFTPFEELKLLTSVDQFMVAFYGQAKQYYVLFLFFF
eukprot:CAMPEP_0202455438 /NCGR_PEP_ID=MMETSP1360-20130828/12970_1 /ASSEMBLY_ACC=CAM_ASM_000848 /TAXON_ID=515479 /ORGANISM="Licmophora paradoxa, Strain CCMP2313" /LENGTH=167 /DNA_ID=CAMNT_0049075027 /DNA_START=109 /DNA_END=612 /DNA_ORIENTATION=+